MEIYLCWDNDNKKILFPVNPSAFTIEASQNNQSVYIHNLGELSLKGKRGLYSITLESFFPAQKYNFQQGKWHDPYEYYCEKIKALFEKNQTAHLVITGTDINMYCTIDSFSYGESDQSGDVSFSLTLKEYRTSATAKRISTKKKNTTYTWRKGDTWPKVTKKHTGSSSTWKNVRKSNIATVNKAKRKNPKKKEALALVGYEVTIK